MAEKHSVSDAVMGAPDKIMSFETGQLAGLADGSVSVSYTHLTLPTICSV